MIKASWIKLFLVAVSIPLVLLILVVIYFFKDGLLGECDVSEPYSIESSDHAYIAKIIIRECGATTAQSAHVEIRSIAEGNDPATIFTIKETHDLQIKWTDARNLIVTIQERDSQAIFRQLNTWRDVTVSYEVIPIEQSHP